MKTLEEWNEEKESRFDIGEPRYNDIECPRCGWGLYDSKPWEIITEENGKPCYPKTEVICKNCNFKGFRKV